MKITHFFFIIILLCSFSVGSAGASPDQPDLITVNTLIDEQDGDCTTDGDCSLRDAIALVPTGASISVPITGTIELELGELKITKSMKILGPGRDSLSISGRGMHRVFYINPSYTLSVTIRDVTIFNGFSEDNGGGLYNLGNLTLERCTIANNYAVQDGGGVYNRYEYGRLEVKQCSFLNNIAQVGGGLKNESASAIVWNATFRGNVAEVRGGGMDNSQTLGKSASTVEIRNSTFSENTNGGVTNPGSTTTAMNTVIAGNTGYDCQGDFAVSVSSSNLSTDDHCYPGFQLTSLYNLRLNWQGWVYALSVGSSAIDRGTNTGCLSEDQMDNPRPQDGDGDGTETCDVGAFEAAPLPLPEVRLFLPLVVRQ